jgi:carbon monoxide dehydrogenase subunit G
MGRRLLAAAAHVVWVVLLTVRLGASPGAEGGLPVTVRELRGVYTVSATFDVPQATSAVLAVLTDYEQIPRFMPDVRTSIVRERAAGRAVVEQEAVSKFMMFSKRVHLVLDVVEGVDTLAFRDRCGSSFRQYAGRWTVSRTEAGTSITYDLTAEPSFDVPEFILKRLLRRDSREMIARLQQEVAARTPR